MDKAWIKKFIMKIVEEHLDRILDSNSITSWEINSLRDANDKGLIKCNKGQLILPDGRKWSLMTLNHEYLSHIAIYFELIQSGEYSKESIRLEYQQMDLVIFNENQVADVAVEVKRSENEGRLLLKKMLEICQRPPLDVNDRGYDALRKVKCLLSIRPTNFWIVTPTMRWKFQVQYLDSGFNLIKVVTEKVA